MYMSPVLTSKYLVLAQERIQGHYWYLTVHSISFEDALKE